MCKIKGNLFLNLKTAIDTVLEISKFTSYEEVLDHYVKFNIGKDHAERARWDLFWCVEKETRDVLTRKIYRELELNDSHIDTALKRITGIR